MYNEYWKINYEEVLSRTLLKKLRHTTCAFGLMFFNLRRIFIMTEDYSKDLSLLGNQNVEYKFDYNPEILETFENGHIGRDYFVKFNCPEFTTLCPMTGQPDFATIYISYIPDVKMVESKALKLYLFSFRNHGGFHENSMNMIMDDLIKLMDPKYIEVWGKFTPRGGISIDPYVNYGRPGTKYEEMADHRMMNHDLYPEKIDNR
jgi:7-cyano-7-deazaguanine reductase